ncbi:MAG: flagellar biosynthesis protein FlhB [Oscillospiraceae bacterium]|nr:flagellar biosynthesis protein FlhB [Oscillospiraceae bacterium]
MAESAGEKTEKATDHKRREERKKGNVMQSKDVVTAAFILAIFGVLRIMAKTMYTASVETVAYWMSIAGKGMGIDGTTIEGMQVYAKLVLEIGRVLIITAGPILIVSMLITIVGTGAQTKFLFSSETIKFKIDKLNPFNGIKRMFSLSSAFELVKSLLKLIILAFVVYDEIEKRVPEFARLFEMDILKGLVYMAESTFSIVMKVGIVFVAVAVVDVLFQYYKFEKDMKMTKQEVKEEYKSLEGDPQVKGKRRQIQRQMAMSRMMADVPDADVVIRNPTHFAVAIKYDEYKNNAPIVLAKGADNLAMKIVDIAEKNKVTMVENKPLARGLYDSVEVGREVPPEFYHAVAEVLVFVYNLRNQKKNY